MRPPRAGAVSHSRRQGEALHQLRQADPLLLAGLVGFLVFDMLTFWPSVRAVGASPDLALIGMAYLIGQLAIAKLNRKIALRRAEIGRKMPAQVPSLWASRAVRPAARRGHRATRELAHFHAFRAGPVRAHDHSYGRQFVKG